MELFLRRKSRSKEAFAACAGLILLLIPKVSQACSVCFYGDSDAAANRGLRGGVLTILAALAVIMVIFVYFLVKFNKRSKIFTGQT